MAIYTIFSHAPDFPKSVTAAERLTFMELENHGGQIMEKAMWFIRAYTPIESGYMQSAATAWDWRTYTTGSFAFRAGWRKQDFGDNFYPAAVLEGTGVFSSSPHRIYPVTKPALAWQNFGSSAWSRAASIKGQPPQPVLSEARDDWEDWMIHFFDKVRLHSWQKRV